ncbi:GM12245 [Drosophila sechellia]|uniref:GM12245 n=1 Tax=Drosophila sechellia TaxID=7238 RepID=B4HZ91_DROSE|nr:GM12245 [Drosophila sechellia]
MAWKMGGNRAAALALLFASSLLLLSAANGADLDTESDDFEDGYVEDVQEEPVAIDGDEKLAYESPVIDAKKFHFADHFDDVEASRKRWVLSQAKKDDIAEEISKYDGIWNWESPQRIVWANDLGLVLKSKAKHAAIAAPLRQPFESSRTTRWWCSMRSRCRFVTKRKALGRINRWAKPINTRSLTQFPFYTGSLFSSMTRHRIPSCLDRTSAATM